MQVDEPLLGDEERLVAQLLLGFAAARADEGGDVLHPAEDLGGVGRFVLGLGDDARGEVGEGEGIGLLGFAHGRNRVVVRREGNHAGQKKPRGRATRERARSLPQRPRKGNRKIAAPEKKPS